MSPKKTKKTPVQKKKRLSKKEEAKREMARLIRQHLEEPQMLAFLIT